MMSTHRFVILLTFLIVGYVLNQSTAEDNDGLKETKITLPGVSPQKDDSYYCTAKKVEDDLSYIVEFQPITQPKTAHHMLLFGCSDPGSKHGIWHCGEMDPVCHGRSNIMYAWAHNAGYDRYRLPEGVGFKIGKSTDIRYIVTQVHYGHVEKFKDGKKDYSGIAIYTTPERQKFIAGIYLLAPGLAKIPPHRERTTVDMACKIVSARSRLYPFATRVHAHTLGRKVEGYRIRNREWTTIVKRSPQLPQIFYPLDKEMELSQGDKVLIRCIYDSTNRTTTTRMGPTMNDEMCNLYIMYAIDSQYPATIESHCSYPGTGVASYVDYLEQMDMKQKSSNAERANKAVHLVQEEAWSKAIVKTKIGLSAAVAVDIHGYVYIFHRGDREWTESTFNLDNIYQYQNDGPIREPTIVKLHPKDGHMVDNLGRNLFYFPHGITIDSELNIWVTDVALHQVFKLDKNGKVKLVLGERFVPGYDAKHFCKPTAVAVDEITKNFFVADGYCNARILCYSSSGELLAEVGRPANNFWTAFATPHSLTINKQHGLLYIADRENFRIQVLNIKTYKVVKSFSLIKAKIRPYGIDYNPAFGGVLYVVSYDDPMDPFSSPRVLPGLTLNATTGELLQEWQPKHTVFHTPHGVAASMPDENQGVYVVELLNSTIWKFVYSSN